MPTMKNFARLVRFAWPYRLRFGLSIACALMVAVLYGADIAAVSPLLKILFYNENCQKWIAEKIVSLETDQRAIDGKIAQAKFVKAMSDPTNPQLLNPKDPRLVEHFKVVWNEYHKRDRVVQDLERQIDDSSPSKPRVVNCKSRPPAAESSNNFPTPSNETLRWPLSKTGLPRLNTNGPA
jgi:hypothetical protein